LRLAPSTAEGVTTSGKLAPKPPLAHQGRWFLDAKGRVVILHGVNMVYKVGSFRPADSGFGPDDANLVMEQLEGYLAKKA